MSIVQVALSFAVEIWKFHNIDLFHQGAFQIRSYFKVNGSTPVLTETPKILNESKITFPECIRNSYISNSDPKLNIPPKAVSKSVMIIYKEESLRMDDVFEQTMYLQGEVMVIEDLIYKSEIILVVELWFGEKRNEKIDEMKFVCERQLKVHLIPSKGLHHHITVLFDYYYLAAVELVVHASLVSISPCYLRLPPASTNETDSSFEKNVTLYQSWHSILFNSTRNCGRRHAACLVHSQICQMLLSIIDNLVSTFQESMSFLNENQKSDMEKKLRLFLCPVLSKSNSASQNMLIDWVKSTNDLDRLTSILQSQSSDDDISNQVSIDVTKLSSRALVLFNEFVKTAAFNPFYVESLSSRTHKLRIKRFSEAFFFQEFPIANLLAVYDPNLNNHEIIVSRVRDSAYYKRLPPLPIECPETDGESYDQPIIIEELFIQESKPFMFWNDLQRSDSSSSSDVDGSRALAKQDTQNVRKGRNKFENNFIPVSRRLNSNYNPKNLPIQEKRVNLVGYRSVECNAFDDNLHKKLSKNVTSDINLSRCKAGIGTLKDVNGFSSFTNPWKTEDLQMIKNLSLSMPDLSNNGYKTKLRKKQDLKNIYNRFSSIYELEETQPWNSLESEVPESSWNLQKSDENKDDHKAKSNTVEMLPSSRSQRPLSLYLSSPDRAPSDSVFQVYQNNISKSSKDLCLMNCSTPPESNINEQVTFCKLKAKLMTDLSPQFQGNVYSERHKIFASEKPYFCLRDLDNISISSNIHYIICVHGLDGEHRDLRLVKTYLTLALPEKRFEFLMSEANELDTFADINIMKERLIDEIFENLSELKEKPDKISFIGHSLGCLLIRAAVASPRMDQLASRFHTFLSLGGPHLGTIYGSSVLVNVGLWVMQKMRKSICLQQLSLKDSPTDLRQSYLYCLSKQQGLEYFKNVLLVSSPQDRYVPYHSTRIQLCKAAVKDNSEMGVMYMEMVTNILQRLVRFGKTNVIRYDAHYALPRSADNYIGRAAHIAFIYSELFLEKFICVSAAKYFK